MKKKIFRFLSFVFPGLLLTGSSKAQGFDIQQLILDVQKLATLKGMLTDMKNGYAALDQDYSAIRDIAKGNFNLHEAFLDGLLLVSPTVRSYQRAADIVSLQTSLVSKYQNAWPFFQQTYSSRPAELAVIGRVYGGLLYDGLQDLNDLSTVLTDGTVRASDAERMQQIDVIYQRMADRVAFIDRFNNSTALLAAQRQGVYDEDHTIQNLHGINP
ncbi:MAG TPA: TerB family tellurite resistance protein [Puia sp.]|nr:TerB family tellurite resistance protein [Puia sp.]